MLRVCRRGEVAEARSLTPEEDRALREAFGRFAVPAARAAGTAVVQRYQHAGAGHWFACSCLGPGVRPPVLVPVAEAHIRRHQDPPWPAHAEECDFYRDPDEQRLVTRSYARPRRGDLIRLVGKLKAEEKPSPLELRSRSYARARGALATLLAELLVRAGLNRIGPDGSVPAIAEQFRALPHRGCWATWSAPCPRASGARAGRDGNGAAERQQAHASSVRARVTSCAGAFQEAQSTRVRRC